MIAVKLLPLVQVLLVLCGPSHAYPTVYGTKRYGRPQRSAYQVDPMLHSPAVAAAAAPAPAPASARYPNMNYYEMYPYASQSYPDEYYYDAPMSSYPVYYPRTSKYEVYQAVLPYYYDRPTMMRNTGAGTAGYGYYGYDDADPMVDIEDMIHDTQRKQREDSQTIGQETYFEDDPMMSTHPMSSEDSNGYYNDVNAAFLNNLIMSQMYKDSLDKGYSFDEDDLDEEVDGDDDEIYGKIDSYPPPQSKQPSYFNEDEEVLELKNLAGAGKNHHQQLKPTEDRWSWFQKGSNKNLNGFYDAGEKRSVDGHLEWFTDRADRKTNNAKSTVLPPAAGTATTKMTVTTTTTTAPRKKVQQRGQKEEVLPRPATPVKHPFAAPVLEGVYKKDRQRQPSVYDTIKHMLDMEKSLETNENAGIKPAMRKRIVSSEDSLTRQLSVLKKHV